jgi:hypothetical protein
MVNVVAAGGRAQEVRGRVLNGLAPMKRIRSSKPLAAGGLAALVVLVGAACGGSGGSTTTTEAEAMQAWANGLTTLGDTLKGGNLSKDSLNSALDTAKSATKTFGDEIKAVGSPPVSESKTKQVLDDLQSELSKDADTIESALSDISNLNEALSAVSTVTGTLATVGTQISSAHDEIKQADPKGSIQSAFQNAPACSSLIGSGS